MKHKHYDMIVAWAEGKEIEYLYCGYWYRASDPRWEAGRLYRIKPEPKPDLGKLLCVDQWGRHVSQPLPELPRANLRLIFDGETGELKSAEVLK